MKEKILIDLKNAMKNQNRDLLSVIRMVKGAIQLEEIKLKHVLKDDEVIGIISHEIKTRKESIMEFKKADRQDLIDKTSKEIEILQKYLPVQLTNEELNTIINDVFNEVKPTAQSDMGNIMSKITPIVKGKTDMSEVSKRIKERLINI